MIDKANAEGSLGITHDGRGANKPATSISWFEAATVRQLAQHRVAAAHPPTSSTAAAIFSCGSPAMRATTRTISIATARPSIFCPASTSGTRRPTTTRTAESISTTRPAATHVPTASSSGTAADHGRLRSSFTTGPADITSGRSESLRHDGPGRQCLGMGRDRLDLVNDSTSSARGVRGGVGTTASPLCRRRPDNGNPPLRGASTLVFASQVSSPFFTTLSWNQLGPGTFGYETAANWTPSQTPTADTDVLFPLDGDVDVIPFSTSVANNVTFSDGIVRLKSLGSTTFTSHGSVTVDDPLAANLAGGAFATLDGTNGHSWTTSLDLQVGNAGFGTFIVNNGGRLRRPADTRRQSSWGRGGSYGYRHRFHDRCHTQHRHEPLPNRFCRRYGNPERTGWSHRLQ